MKLSKKINQIKTQKRHFQFQNDNTSFEINEFDSTNISFQSKHTKNNKIKISFLNTIRWLTETFQLFINLFFRFEK